MPGHRKCDPPSIDQLDAFVSCAVEAGPKKTKHVSRAVVDAVCSLMLKDGIPAADVYFAAVGVDRALFKKVMVDGAAAGADERDRYIREKVSKTSAQVEIDCLKRWKAGESGAERMLQALVRRYNSNFMAELNGELQHMLRIVASNVDETTLLKILDDILEYNPDLEAGGDVHLTLPTPRKSDPMPKRLMRCGEE